MADTGAVETKNDDTSSRAKPNEVKAMLVDIHMSISSIMIENKQFNEIIRIDSFPSTQRQ